MIQDPWLAVPLILVEATGSAIGSPALFTVIAARQPGGPRVDGAGDRRGVRDARVRVASLVTGAAAAIDIRLPFYLFAIVMTTLSLAAFAVAWPRLRERSAAMAVTAEAAGQV